MRGAGLGRVALYRQTAGPRGNRLGLRAQSARLPDGRPMGNGCTLAPAQAALFTFGVSNSRMANRSRSPRDRRRRKVSLWPPMDARSLRLLVQGRAAFG